MSNPLPFLASGVAAFVLWGLLPIYWKALGQLDPQAIVAYRIIWSVPALLLTRYFLRFMPWKKSIDARELFTPHALLFSAGSALLIGSNWLIYVWAVNNELVLQGSLAYFVTPLFLVCLGVVFFREKLSVGQIRAVWLAAAGVALMAISSGQLPLVALSLMLTFSCYATIRKLSPLGPIDGLLVEMLLLSVPALIYLSASGAFVPPEVDFYMVVLAGPLTVLPLALYIGASRGLPLSTLGVIQFLAPTIQFLLAVLAFEEPFSVVDGISFTLVWVGVVLFANDLRRQKKNK